MQGREHPDSPNMLSLCRIPGREERKELFAADCFGQHRSHTHLQTPQPPNTSNLRQAPKTGHFLIEYNINYHVHH